MSNIDEPNLVDNEYAKAICNICKIDIPLTLIEEHLSDKHRRRRKK